MQGQYAGIDEKDHKAGGQQQQLVGKVVGAQKFCRSKVGNGVEPYGEIGEACEASKCIGRCRLEHQQEEFLGMVADFQDLGGERLAYAKTEGGYGRKYHGKGDKPYGIEVEPIKAGSHDQGEGNGVENFGKEHFFPELPADKVPVEKRMLEEQPGDKDEFAIEGGVVTPHGQGEYRHQHGSNGGHEQPKLEYMGKEPTFGGPLAKVGQNKGHHAEIGNGTKDGVVILQDSKVAVVYNSQIFSDNILNKNIDALDKYVYQGNENANLNVLEYLQRGIK